MTCKQKFKRKIIGKCFKLRRTKRKSWDEILRLGVGYAECGSEMNGIRNEVNMCTVTGQGQ